MEQIEFLGDDFDLGPETALFLYCRGKVYRLTGECVHDRQLQRALAAALGGGADAAGRIAAAAMSPIPVSPTPVSPTPAIEQSAPRIPAATAAKLFDCPICWRRGPAAEQLEHRRVRCGACNAVFVPGARSPMADMMATAGRRAAKTAAKANKPTQRPAAMAKELAAWLPSKKIIGIVAAVAAVVALGWTILPRLGGPSVPPLVPVSGHVTFEGKTISGASISFRPRDKSLASLPMPRAVVGPDGRFLVGTFDANDGAPAGDYDVSIQWFPAPSSNDENILPRNQLPSRYAHPDTSGLTVRIDSGPTELPTLQLKR